VYSKFFGKPNGAKPEAPQQSKLSFSTKSTAKQEDVKENVPTPSGGGPKERKDIKSEDVAMAEALDEEVAAPVKANGAKNTKKRTVKEDENERSDTEDVEPPAKKARIKSEGKTNGANVITKKSKSASTLKSSPKVKEENSSPVSTKKSKGQSRRKVIEEDEEDEEDEEVAAPISKKLPQKDVKEPEDNKPASDSSASDEEAGSGSEEDKPEIAVKQREKVQATLKADTKDPYPDWKAGDPVPYAALCTTFSKIEMTTKRLEIAAHCSRFLRQVMRLTPDDLLPTVLLMVNKLAADYAGIELGIGESLIMKAIGESTGRSLQVIKADQKQIGDLGLVAAKSRSNQPTMMKPKALTIRGVHKGLLDIATIQGHGAQGNKVAGIKKLLSAADVAQAGKGKVDITKDKGGPSEAKFIVRTLEGKLRLGLADKSVLVALASAVVFHEASQKGKVPSADQLASGESILKSVYRYI
jgi:DNA ligase-1